VEKTFGEDSKLEVTMGITWNWGKWGLPLAIGIWTTKGRNVGNEYTRFRNIDVSLDILCIRLFIDIWRWK